MKYKSQISILLVIALIMGCMGWAPATAQQVQEENAAPSVAETSQKESLTEDSKILDYVDSEQFLQADHIARLPQEETLDSYVFLNRDGTRSVYYMGRPVKYVDENGTIHEKDTTLVRSKSGYGMRDNDVALHIPDAAATGITMSHNQRSIKLTPQGGSGSAQMADNSIDYVNFFGKGTILRYTPMLSGMKEDIILAEYTGQNSFTFLLETNGLNLYQDQGRYYLAESQDVEAAFYLGQIDVYDAIGRPDLGTMTAETIVPGQRYRLTVSADEEFLTDPETVYPVTIDPTLTVRDSEEVRGTLEDTPVFSNYPIRNFGNYTFNSMGYVEGFGTAMTAVRLTGLLADTNYAQLTADQLNSVTFHIKSAGGSYANISVHALTENSTWTEMGLTWNTLGAYSTNSYATQAMGNVLWDAFNITNLAKEWKNGTQNPQCGFVLISDSTTIRTATYGGEYGTIDYRPYVVVNYSNAITLDQTSTSVYKGNTLTLTATTIPAGQAVTWESDAPAIASVSDTGVVTGLSKGTATITVTLDAVTSASCTVEVLEKTISFDYNAVVEVYKGKTVPLEPITQPAGEPVTWSSLNPDVATVSNGVVTGVSPGNATIRAALSDGTEALCIVIVIDWDIWLDEESLIIAVGETCDIDAYTTPPDLPFNWNTGDSSVAIVNENGLITAISSGETYITAELSDGKTAGCFVTVVEKQVSIEAERSDVDEGDPLYLSARTTPENRSVTWTSSDPAIATVNQNGVVTGIKAGVVTITATMTDGPSANYTVYVTIEDGVYYISNMFSGYCLQTEGRKITDFTNVVQDYKLQSTVAETARIAQMWRITYLDEGKYTIRPISKVDVCLYAEWCTSAWAEPVVIYPHADDDYENVPTRAQWTITMTDRGYAIQYCGVDDYTLKVKDGSGMPNAQIIVGSYSATMYSCHWGLTRITDIPVGFVLYDLRTGLPADTSVTRYIAPGEKSFFGLEVVGYPIRYYEHYVRMSVQNTKLADFNQYGYVVGISGGETSVLISFDLYGVVNSLSTSFTLIVTDCPIGTYYIRNRFSFQYASAETTVGSNVTQKMFNPGEITGWEVRHTGQGYYTIRSTIEGAEYYLGISDEISQENANIVLCADASTEKTQWEILMLESGAYTLRLKGSSYSLGLKYRLFGDYDSSGIALQQRAFQSDKKFEWLFCEVSNAVILEAQETPFWCWAASARMMASIYMNSQISQAAAAVYVKNGGSDNPLFPTDSQIADATGDGPDALKMDAVNYLLGRKGNYGILHATDAGYIYSEEVLCRILDAGYPVMINRRMVEEDTLGSGHATIIQSYYYDEDKQANMFVIYDPLTTNNCTYKNGKFLTVAQIYHRTYKWILDSKQNPSDEDDSGIMGNVWESAVVYIYCEDYDNTKTNCYRNNYS